MVDTLEKDLNICKEAKNKGIANSAPVFSYLFPTSHKYFLLVFFTTSYFYLYPRRTLVFFSFVFFSTWYDFVSIELKLVWLCDRALGVMMNNQYGFDDSYVIWRGCDVVFVLYALIFECITYFLSAAKVYYNLAFFFSKP